MNEDDSRAVQTISDHLIELGLRQAPVARQMERFCEQLLALGVPLLRGNVSARTMHPLIDSVSHVWHRGKSVETNANTLEQAASARWQQSPLRHIVENMDTRLHRTDLTDLEKTKPWPVFAEFRAEGATEHLAKLIGFGVDGAISGKTGVVLTWLTDRPGGFENRDVAILQRLMPRLALSVKSTVDHEIARNLLRTYMGDHASEEILAGDYRRGSFQTIPAAILFADLRDFTTISGHLERVAMAELLNRCFDAMVAPIRTHGGEVLKFLGDGLLAVFDRRNLEAADICFGALHAAVEAVAAVAAIDRPETPGRVMELDIALHLGDVLYGNIGAADRLDFTVLGPAVNEASRIESLCSALGRSVLISESFTLAAQHCSDRIIRVGEHHLRGIEAMQVLYGLKDEPAQ
jgi:adenylate cyclase